MQKVRHTANLLDRAVDQAAELGRRLALWLRQPFMMKKSVHQHLHGREILPKTVVQLSRNSPPFAILCRNQTRRKTANSALSSSSWRALRCSSAKTLTFARSSSGTTGTEM